MLVTEYICNFWELVLAKIADIRKMTKIQEMFPDVIRKLFIINAPTFFHVIWKIVSPCLAKQTQEKIRILGDDWKEKLKECIDEDVLYENWGGTRQADTPFGHIRMGGKVPKELRLI